MEGFKAGVFNTQERAISSDLNRIQRFAHRDVAEFLRYWLDVTDSDDNNTGVIAEPASVEIPLRAEIFNGLLCRPQAGSQNVFVDPGVVMLMAPDAGPDESDYKYVHDAGTTTPGALVIAAGAVGTRIDVVECRMNAVDLTATESRDVFDSVTGLFSATVVTKERQGRLEYRVRQGVAAAGYPGNVSGWLPLMVASVPIAAVSNDDVTFWDVRPLLSDRAFGSYNLSRDIPQVTAAQLTFDEVPGLLRGSIDVVSGKGRRLGGRMRRGTPGADADSISLSDAANQSGGALVANTLRYLYLVTPFSLPRWSRYASAPSVRVPRNPRGIPILTGVVPQHQRNAPSAVIALPASTGLGSSTSDAVCIGVVPVNSVAGLSSLLVSNADHHVDLDTTVAVIDNLNISATSLGAGTLTTWDLVPNTNYPANARELYVKMVLVFTAGATTFTDIRPSPGENHPLVWIGTALPGNPAARTLIPVQTFSNFSGAPVSFRFEWTGWIPIPSDEFPAASGGNRRLSFSYNSTAGAPIGGGLAVMGWRF